MKGKKIKETKRTGQDRKQHSHSPHNRPTNDDATDGRELLLHRNLRAWNCG
jgi:hypothetical protein